MHAQDVIEPASHTILPWGGSVPPLSQSPLPSKTHSLITEEQREEVRTKRAQEAKRRVRRGSKRLHANKDNVDNLDCFRSNSPLK